jgi:hypothetical protein
MCAANSKVNPTSGGNIFYKNQNSFLDIKKFSALINPSKLLIYSTAYETVPKSFTHIVKNVFAALSKF